MILYDHGDHHLGFIFRWDGSTLPKAAVFSLPSVSLAVLMRYLLDAGYLDAEGLLQVNSSSLIWTISFFTLSFLVGFRCNSAYQRFWEGCTLIQSMSAEWFESCSNLIAFSRMPAHRLNGGVTLDKVKQFQFKLVRLMSLMHGTALRQVGANQPEDFHVLDLHGLDAGSVDYLAYDCTYFEINRVEVILHWIQALIVHSIDEGVLIVPPPILTRSFQTLSRGMVNLHSVRRIADIPFPFPLSQALIILVLVHCVVTPVFIACIFPSILCTLLLTFMPLLGIWNLVFICGQLEQPFGQDANDLPLHVQQFDFNNSLMMLVDNAASIIPTLNDDAAISAADLREKFLDDESTTASIYAGAHEGYTYRDFLRDKGGQRRSSVLEGDPALPMSAKKGSVALRLSSARLASSLSSVNIAGSERKGSHGSQARASAVSVFGRADAAKTSTSFWLRNVNAKGPRKPSDVSVDVDSQAGQSLSDAGDTPTSSEASACIYEEEGRGEDPKKGCGLNAAPGNSSYFVPSKVEQCCDSHAADTAGKHDEMMTLTEAALARSHTLCAPAAYQQMAVSEIKEVDRSTEEPPDDKADAGTAEPFSALRRIWWSSECTTTSEICQTPSPPPSTTPATGFPANPEDVEGSGSKRSEWGLKGQCDCPELRVMVTADDFRLQWAVPPLAVDDLGNAEAPPEPLDSGSEGEEPHVSGWPVS